MMGRLWAVLAHVGAMLRHLWQQDGDQEPEHAPRWPQDEPRWRPRGCQIQPLWRSWVDFESFWDQFSIILEASWLSGCILKNFQKTICLEMFFEDLRSRMDTKSEKILLKWPC